MKKNKNYHVGGTQAPLFTPSSQWTRLAELPDLRGCKELALDRETKDDGLAQGRGPGWAYGAGHVIGNSIAWKEGNEYKQAYLPTRHPDTDNFDPDQVRQWEIDHNKAGVTFVMFNAPYDVGWGDVEGIPCPDKVDDASCMAFMVDETRPKGDYGLDEVCKWRGLPGKDERLLREAAAIYGHDPKSEMYKLPARYVAEYAGVDALRTLQLAHSFRPDMEREKTLDAYKLEMDLLPLVHAMRKRGIRIDMDAADQAKDHCLAVSEKAFAELREKLGTTNIGIDEARSNAWLERVFTDLKVKFPRDELSGRGSFEAKWMKESDHWLPRTLVRAKSYHEAANKFIQTYIVDFAHNGRIHASVNQFKSEVGGTKTYRTSYAGRPLQQMPHRNEELSGLIRGLFLPEPGEIWLSADYSQQEYRIIVHYAEKAGLPKARDAAEKYRNDPRTDFHSMVAEMTGLDRKPAKDSNFAKSYGAGIAKFALMINKTFDEASAIMEQYDREMPFVKKMNEMCQTKAESTGFIKLLDGARIHFNTWEPVYLSKQEKARGWGSGGRIKMGNCLYDEAMARVKDKDHPWYGKRLRRAQCRKAMNGLVQGGAARQTKKAMKACWDDGHVPLIQMHDELGFSLSSEAAGSRITQIMREIYPLNVPMQVDAEYGISWGKASKIEDKKTKTVIYGATWKEARAALKKAAA